MRALALFATLLIPQLGTAQVPSQRELNGYVIGQHREALDPLGDPDEEMETDDDWLYLTYVVTEKPFLYMLFKFPADDPDHLISVQVAGDPSQAMKPFLGIRLGASSADVRRTFGAPTGVEKLTDPPVDVWRYKDRNYSFEFDGDNGLSSIQIFGFEGFSDPPTGPLPPPWSDIRSALRSTDISVLVAAFAPDAEIYKGDDLFQIDDSMAKVFADPASEFRKGLALALTALGSLEPIEVNARVSLGKDPASVYKFAEGSPVKEIVLVPDAGAWRVWEISLN
jgi:hypothetical protein